MVTISHYLTNDSELLTYFGSDSLMTLSDTHLTQYKISKGNPIAIRAFPYFNNTIIRNIVPSQGDIYEINANKDRFSWKYTVEDIEKIDIKIPYYPIGSIVVPYKNNLLCMELKSGGVIKNITTGKVLQDSGEYAHWGEQYLYIINKGMLMVYTPQNFEPVYVSRTNNFIDYIMVELPNGNLLAYSGFFSTMYLLNGFDIIKIIQCKTPGDHVYVSESYIYTKGFRLFEEV